MKKQPLQGASVAQNPGQRTPPASLSLLKISTGLGEAGDFRKAAVPSRSWWRFSLCPCIDLGFPFSHSRRARAVH